MGGAKWGGNVEKGGILVVVVRRFALLYLAQPATMVRTARPASIRRPSALCWRVGIVLFGLTARRLRCTRRWRLLVATHLRVNSAARQRLYQRVSCRKLAIVCVFAPRFWTACSTARDVRVDGRFAFAKWLL